MYRPSVMFGLVVLGAVSCVGGFEGGMGEGEGGAGGTGATGGSGGSGGQASPVECKGALDVGLTALPRLTPAEYNNTVQYLLKDTTLRPGDSFSGSASAVDGAAVSKNEVAQYVEAAERMAAKAVTNMAALLSCDTATVGEDECAKRFIDSFGRRAYRRALVDEQRNGLFNVYRVNKAAAGFAKGIETVVQAFLLSPEFIYRVEVGTPSGTANINRLDGYELATRLSYLLWATTPDDTLLSSAAMGKMDTVDGIRTEVRRMMGDTKTRRTITAFHDQWLLDDFSSLTKDTRVYATFTPALRQAMRDETVKFAENVVADGDGRLQTLFTAPYTMVNATMATFYGMPGITGTAFVKADVDPAQRAGLLTHPSLMSLYAKANMSSPIFRGKFVREGLLCQHIPEFGGEIKPPDPNPNLTTRQLFAEHTKNPSCAGCHTLMDPLGFGFENYDGIGRYRTTDNKKPVDANGEVTGTAAVDGKYVGAVELAKKLAASSEVHECVANQWFMYAFGRDITNKYDTCSREQVFGAFRSANQNIRELIAALTVSDAFRHKRLTLGGN